MKPWEETWDERLADIGAGTHRFGFFGAISVEGPPGCMEKVVVRRTPDTESIERARLAAAAPELYRALEAAVDLLRLPPSDRESRVLRTEKALEGAAAALRKARGET